ncbi:hypothetical protein [Rhodococcus qingshengii]|uniref:hypothetical protein n=1 Tax=Rhodococcus qingshengii TaxID=334542 RepID=UPI00210BA809|nr:hypothetical protein [Rhodococcus qingshengii]
MANPSLNIPLKPTRALFQLGWGDQGAQRIAWRDGTPDERRAILAALPGGLVDIPASAFTTPAWPFDIDWFASPADLRAALVTLQEKAKTESGAPVRDILAEDPALSDESAKWFTYGGFKGGSSIGSSRVPITWNTTIVPGLSPCKLMVTTLHWLPTRLCTSIRSTTRCS